MTKRILLFLIIFFLLASSGPGISPVVARFIPLPVTVAWAQAEAEEKAVPPFSPVTEEGKGVLPESPTAPPEAAEPKEEPEAAKPKEEPEGLGKKLEQMLHDSGSAIDATHARISKGLFSTADWFDSFFADERSVSECQESRLKLTFSALIKESEAVDFDVRPSFRIELPVLKNRLNFLLAGDEEEKDFQLTPLQEVRQQFLDSNRESFAASLRYFFISTMERNASVQIGVRFRNLMPVPFLEPRYRQSHFFDPWLLRFTQRVTALTNDELEVRSTLDLDRKLNDKILLRNTADGSWFNGRNGYFYDLRVLLFHRLSSRRALEYQWNNFFQTSPNHNLEEIRLRVTYRQQIWRKWLFYEIGPQLTFPRSRDYRYTPGVLLRLEANFGAYN